MLFFCQNIPSNIHHIIFQTQGNILVVTQYHKPTLNTFQRTSKINFLPKKQNVSFFWQKLYHGAHADKHFLQKCNQYFFRKKCSTNLTVVSVFPQKKLHNVSLSHIME